MNDKPVTVHTRFALANTEWGLIDYYPSKVQALRAAAPGDSLYDRMAEPGDIELWLIGGNLESKTLHEIRRKRTK
jgi:hypothetical protein